MPRYYCDYCDSYLTHDSPLGRQQHYRGNRHREKFKEWYSQFYADWCQQAQVDMMIQQQIQYNYATMAPASLPAAPMTAPPPPSGPPPRGVPGAPAFKKPPPSFKRPPKRPNPSSSAPTTD
jgi:U1 small nuclear ribonucleoprotein C